MIIDKKLLEKQIKVLALQLNKKITIKEREAFEGLLNMLGDIAENPPTKQFPNGFECWKETYHEVVEYLTRTEKDEKSLSHKARESAGQTELYVLAERLTDQFENLNEGREWDGEFFDEIEEFMCTQEFLKIY